MNDKRAAKELHKRFDEAEDILHDPNKMDGFLHSINEKLDQAYAIKDKLSSVPLFVSMIKDFVTRKYTKVPVKSIVTVIAALIYFVSPIDVISDFIPVVGLTDDVFVLGVCLKMVSSDLDDYKAWLKNKERFIEVELE